MPGGTPAETGFAGVGCGFRVVSNNTDFFFFLKITFVNLILFMHG